MYHEPVLLKEVLGLWHCKRGGFYIDATVGTGGHSAALLEKDSQAFCCVLDRDPQAVDIAKNRLSKFGNRVLLLKENYRDLKKVIAENKLPKVEGLLLDLGVSSLQLDSPERGFSFMRRGPLDMRMDFTTGENALELIHRLSLKELIQLIHRYGEEPLARPIALALKKADSNRQLTNTVQCAELISNTFLAKKRWFSKGVHPATKTFQALRIGVNKELENLEELLKDVPSLLATGGRVVLISFHSLEDRLIKNWLKKSSRGCVCPSDFPLCVCGRSPELKMLTSKALRPCEGEVERNPRSRSARMRAAEKI